LKHLTARERAYPNAIKAVYNLTIFPNNDCVIENSFALPVSIFHPNVHARVFDFAIHLTSPLDTAEYFYGLTPNSHTYETLSSVIVGVEFNYFVEHDRTAYTSINYVTKDLVRGSITKSIQIGRFCFDEKEHIKEIDNFNPYYSWSIADLIPPSGPIHQEYEATILNQRCTRAIQKLQRFQPPVSVIQKVCSLYEDKGIWNSEFQQMK
jgi:hypothetical protein